MYQSIIQSRFFCGIVEGFIVQSENLNAPSNYQTAFTQETLLHSEVSGLPDKIPSFKEFALSQVPLLEYGSSLHFKGLLHTGYLQPPGS